LLLLLLLLLLQLLLLLMLLLLLLLLLRLRAMLLLWLLLLHWQLGPLSGRLSSSLYHTKTDGDEGQHHSNSDKGKEDLFRRRDFGWVMSF
jgi:hypothetical protein